MAEFCNSDLLELLDLLQLGTELEQIIRIDQPLACDEYRVVRAFPLILPLPDYGAMPPMYRKCPELAEEWRSRGNQELSADKEGALDKYTRSIATAPPGSKQLALGFLNRASALFCLRRYDAAMRDLGRAGTSGLPPESRYKLEEQRARCLNALGCKDAAQNAKKEALRLLQEAGAAVPTVKAEASRSRLLHMSRTRRKAPVNDTRKPLPALAGGPNPNVPGLSRHVDVMYSLERGRHLVANKDIQPGDILLAEEPLAAMLVEKYYNTHCFHCIKRSLDMVPCQDCTQVMFCSEKCRDDAWSEYHQIECKLLPFLCCVNERNEPSTLLKLSLRLTLKTIAAHGGLQAVYEKQKQLEAEPCKGPEAKRIFDADGGYDPSSFRAVYYLPRVYLGAPGFTAFDSLPLHAARILFAIKELTRFLHPDPNGDRARFLGAIILRMITIRMNSNFGMGEYDGNSRYPIGNAVYATSSLINHSCSPNTFQFTTNGGCAVLIASQPIEKGEEITVAYASTYAERPLEARRTELGSYQFTCRCQACKEDWPVWKEPTHSRTDYTLKCHGCGGRFEGPIHRNSVRCTHCACRVQTPIVVHYTRARAEIAKPNGDLKVVLASVRALHQVMAYPNDFLFVINEGLRICFSRTGNLKKDSW